MKDGVGQLTLTFDFTKDEAEETEVDRSAASHLPVDTGKEPEQKQARKRKWNSLIDKVYAPRNLQAAWERVKANKGAPGLDGMTIKKFEARLEERLAQLSQDLRAKTYKPQPVKRVFIPKSGGGQRPLGIPTVRDRIVQQALLQVLSPIFEAKFSKRSHGFRPGRGCASALQVVDAAIQHGYTWVVDADIQSFFDTVDHEKLVDAVAEEVADGSVLRLIRSILKSGALLPGSTEQEQTELGTPQGGPISPMLANIYLHRFDAAIEEAKLGLVRYADDFVIFTRSEEEAHQALELARKVLEGELGLHLHPEKTCVVTVAHGFQFLGYHYFMDPKWGKLRKEVRPKSLRAFRDAIRKRTPRLRNQRLPKRSQIRLDRLKQNERLTEIIEDLDRYLKGWIWYFKHVWSYDDYFNRFDRFVRRRLRTAITGRTGHQGWWQAELKNSTLDSLGLPRLEHLAEGYKRGFWESSTRKG